MYDKLYGTTVRKLPPHHHLVVLVGPGIHPDMIVVAPLGWRQGQGVCGRTSGRREFRHDK